MPKASPVIPRIAIVGPSRSPVAEPFEGGLQSYVWTLTTVLRQRGHDVTLFAAPGSDPDLCPQELDLGGPALSDSARRDVSMPADAHLRDHHAYLGLMLRLIANADRFDLVHNHSFHHLPVAMGPALRIPMITTLHTPPTPWLESAITLARPTASDFVAVSRHTAAAWRHALGEVASVPNGVDPQRWRMGPGGGRAVWSGRMVPEKAPHVALDAARRAGIGLDLAGPVVDAGYFDSCVRPRLGEHARYVGHLAQPELSDLVRHACVAVVSPEWDEPYGLVVAEALASGTPVAAFARGGVPEILTPLSGCLAPPGDVRALAAAITAAARLDRAEARRRAVSHCSVATMIDGYESMFSQALAA